MAHETGEPQNLLILGVGLTSVVVLVGVMFGLQSYFYEVRDADVKEFAACPGQQKQLWA